MNDNQYDTDTCELCGEPFKDSDQVAEMYDPADDADSVICHAQCGLNEDFEVA